MDQDNADLHIGVDGRIGVCSWFISSYHSKKCRSKNGIEEWRFQIIFILLDNHKTYNRELKLFQISYKPAQKQPGLSNGPQTLF